MRFHCKYPMTTVRRRQCCLGCLLVACLMVTFWFWSGGRECDIYGRNHKIYPSEGFPDFRSPILTLFTTIKDLDYRNQTHLNTIRNWAQLLPWVVPVLFVRNKTADLRNESSWGSIAKRYGWRILEYSRAKNNIPIFKTMFSDVQKTGITTLFYGYANADILFDISLISTLALYRKETYFIEKNTVLISGRRKNIDLRILGLLGNPTDSDQLALLGSHLRLFWDNSADYFIFSEAGFNWDQVPDFVVGRGGYDSWLLAAATDWKVDQLDASTTINALHQTGVDGNHAGETINDADKDMNMDLVPGFNPSNGRHACAPRTSHHHHGCYEPFPRCMIIFTRMKEDLELNQCFDKRLP